MRPTRPLPALLVLLATIPAVAAPEPIAVAMPDRKEPVSYAKEVAEVLGAKCVGCHGVALAENKLNLEDVAGMLKGGKRGPAIVPGKADESLLFKMAAHRVEPVMPPKDKKGQEPLTPGELGLLQRWIDEGVKDDSEANEGPARPIELGTLPPGVHPIVALDMLDDGARVAFGRANVVQVCDVASGLEIVTLGGHRDIIQSVRYSPDGRRLAAGSYQIVTLWDVPTGGPAATYSGHGDQVKALAVSADGKAMFSGGLDRTIRVWDVASGKQVRQLNSPAPVLALALAPDGKTLAAGGADQVVRLLRADDGQERAALKGHAGPIHDLAFLPDGRHIASASADGSARVWDVTGSAEPLILNGHKGPLRAVAVSPDGRLIATGGDDAAIRLWHAEDGRLIRTIEGQGGPVLALAIGPDGRSLLAGSADKSARLFDLASGAIIRKLEGHAGAVQSVAFAPGGDRLATAGAEGGVKVWEADSGLGVIAFGHAPPNGGVLQPLQRVAFAGEGSLISASADRTLRRWMFEGRWAERRPLGPHAFRVLALDFNPDGTLLAAGGGEPSRSGEVRLWEVGKGLPVRTLDALHSDTVFGLRFSPDGSKLASVAADKFLKVTAVADGKELRSFEGHTHHVLAVDWKPDGKQLVTGGADNLLKFWDYETGEQLRSSQPVGKQVTAVRWVPEKPTEVVGASGDKLVRAWNADNGGVIRNFGGPGDYIFGVATSKDGARIAAGGADGVLFVWDGRNGQVVRKIEPAAP